MSMTTTERPPAIAGYVENTEQAPSAAAGPPPEAGGSIAQVEASRTQAEITDPRKEKIKCLVPGCGKMITKKNMEQHRRNIHKLYKRGPRGVAPAADTELKPPAPKRTKVTADETVLIVVQMRWPNGVPVDQVPALLEWQRATERFFNA